MKKARLVLEDGTTYNGFSFGAPVGVAGEVVFQTGMVRVMRALCSDCHAQLNRILIVF